MSHDAKSNTSTTRHTAVVEICPLCKGDLVAAPLGGGGERALALALVHRVTAVLTLVQVHPPAAPGRAPHVEEVSAERYWRKPSAFVALRSDGALR